MKIPVPPINPVRAFLFLPHICLMRATYLYPDGPLPPHPPEPADPILRDIKSSEMQCEYFKQKFHMECRRLFGSPDEEDCKHYADLIEHYCRRKGSCKAI